MALYNYTGTVTYGDLAKKSYTLDDLEKDDEFQKTSERFLESVGEKSDDVFEYLRDSDFNLFSGMNNDDLLYFTNIDNNDSESDA